MDCCLTMVAVVVAASTGHVRDDGRVGLVASFVVSSRCRSVTELFVSNDSPDAFIFVCVKLPVTLGLD